MYTATGNVTNTTSTTFVQYPHYFWICGGSYQNPPSGDGIGTYGTKCGPKVTSQLPGGAGWAGALLEVVLDGGYRLESEELSTSVMNWHWRE